MSTAFATPNRNAAKHNCTSKLLILPDESHAEFSALHASLIAEYQPQTEMQNQTVDEAARAVWELRRMNREFDKTQKKLYAQQPNMSDWTPPQHAEYERILRYRTRAERTHSRSLKSLEYLRTLRLRAEQRAFWETIQLSKLDISERRLQLTAQRFQEESKHRENKEKLRKEKEAEQAGKPAHHSVKLNQSRALLASQCHLPKYSPRVSSSETEPGTLVTHPSEELPRTSNRLSK